MLRITAGEFRGRTLRTPAGERTRPTQARLRQALFNSLQSHIEGARVLDLFAGSGALGFEALSRGAAEVVFVEIAKPALKLIRQNAEELRVLDRIRCIGESVDRAVSKIGAHAPYDIVLADPPYALEWEERLLNELPWSELLVPGGFFCLEWGALKSRVESLPEKSRSLVKVREKNYGEAMLTTYRHADSNGDHLEGQDDG